MLLSKKLLFFISIYFVCQNVFAANATNRSDAITTATNHASVNWTVNENNIIDNIKFVYEEDEFGSYEWNEYPGQDGIDDRIEKDVDGNSRIDIIDANQNGIIDPSEIAIARYTWPFFPKDVVPGEAYALGHAETVPTFRANAGGSNGKWIAGYDPDSKLPKVSTSGYNGYTGLDCSSFVSRCLNLTTIANTTGLIAESLQITPDKAKRGDLLYSSALGHIVMLADDSIFGGKVDIYQSGTWKYSKSQRIESVVGESTNYNIDGSGNLSLEYVSKHQYYQHTVYTPFPIFPSVTPGPGDTVGTTPEIKVTIKSATNIDDDNVYMEIDGDKVAPVITSYSKDTKQMTLSYTPTEDNALAPGDHQIYVYAENALSLADDITSSFNVEKEKTEGIGELDAESPDCEVNQVMYQDFEDALPMKYVVKFESIDSSDLKFNKDGSLSSDLPDNAVLGKQYAITGKGLITINIPEINESGDNGDDVLIRKAEKTEGVVKYGIMITKDNNLGFIAKISYQYVQGAEYPIIYQKTVEGGSTIIDETDSFNDISRNRTLSVQLNGNRMEFVTIPGQKFSGQDKGYLDITNIKPNQGN